MDFKKSIQNLGNSNFWDNIPSLSLCFSDTCNAFLTVLAFMLGKHLLKERSKKNDHNLQEKAKDNEVSRLERVAKIKTLAKASVNGTLVEYRSPSKKKLISTNLQGQNLSSQKTK